MYLYKLYNYIISIYRHIYIHKLRLYKYIYIMYAMRLEISIMKQSPPSI